MGIESGIYWEDLPHCQYPCKKINNELLRGWFGHYGTLSHVVCDAVLCQNNRIQLVTLVLNGV